jgi:hypothetical protein
MKLLLDAHVLIWMVYRPERLSAAARAAITAPALRGSETSRRLDRQRDGIG